MTVDRPKDPAPVDLPRIFTIRESSHRIHNSFSYLGRGVFALIDR
jgi:hypothetical protein